MYHRMHLKGTCQNIDIIVAQVWPVTIGVNYFHFKKAQQVDWAKPQDINRVGNHWRCVSNELVHMGPYGYWAAGPPHVNHSFVWFLCHNAYIDTVQCPGVGNGGSSLIAITNWILESENSFESDN